MTYNVLGNGHITPGPSDRVRSGEHTALVNAWSREPELSEDRHPPDPRSVQELRTKIFNNGNILSEDGKRRRKMTPIAADIADHFCG